MLENLSQYQDEPLVKFAIQICRWHHERYDGSGYPYGMHGEELPEMVRIISAADALDAIEF